MSHAKRTRPQVLFVMLALLVPSLGHAHPFHISTAEMEFNAQTNKIEVSLKLHSVDLERALSKLSGSGVDLDKDVNDALVVEYLNRHFYLLSHAQALLIEQGEAGKADAPRSAVSLVGKELKSSWMWLYFEMSRPAIEDDFAMVNTILLDIAAGQINTVSVRHDAKRDAFRMSAKQPWCQIPRHWLVPAAPRVKNF